MTLQFTRLIAAAATAGLLLGGCGGGGNGSSGIPSTTSVNPTSVGKLSFAVGTANIQGTTTALNVVTTYRTASGVGASLTNTPTISGPSPFFVGVTPSGEGAGADAYSTVPAPGATPVPLITPGPGVLDTSSGTITGTPQTIPYGANVPTESSTFGQSGGVFSQGLAPGNEYVSTNRAFSYEPYNIDVYETVFSSNSDPAAIPWGGPPSFDPNADGMGLRDGLSTLKYGVIGIPEGFTAFTGVTPTTGNYTMNLSVPTGHNGSTPTFATVTGTAAITSTAVLPALDPTLLAFTPDANGGATYTIPASYFTGGIKEVYIQVVDLGDGGTNCQGTYGPAFAPDYYTVVATAPGTNIQFPDTDGPNTAVGTGPTTLTPSESICTATANTLANGGTPTPGDTYEVMVIALDYDAFGNTFISTSKPPAQVATWNGTQADISVSTTATGVSPAVPALTKRAGLIIKRHH
jgi:hypothetical protein